MGEKAVKAEETEPTLESSSLETPKITVEGEEKKDCEEGRSAHPLDAIQENPALIHLFTDAALLDRLVASWTAPTNRDGGASPLLEERLKPDEQMQGAVEEEKKIGDVADQKAADDEAGDVAVKVAESAVAQPAGESEDGAT